MLLGLLIRSWVGDAWECLEPVSQWVIALWIDGMRLCASSDDDDGVL